MAAQPFTVHEVLGLMHVPVSATPTETADFLHSHAAMARERLQSYLQTSSEEREGMLLVKRLYQLQGLTRDYAAISSYDERQCTVGGQGADLSFDVGGM